MHLSIKFDHLSDIDFAELKEKIVFNALKLSPPSSTFGENVYAGNTPENKGCFLFEYHDEQIPVISFIILSGGEHVYYHYTNEASQQSVHSLIRGNITKFCIQEQERFCLHASAMCVLDKTVLFVGRKGAGKSTLATYFHLNDHEIWCDDYAILHEEASAFYASQGETSLKINPDIAEAFNISAKNLSPVFNVPSDWKKDEPTSIITKKFYFNQQDHKVNSKARKVAAIFFINPRSANPKDIVMPIQQKDALAILMDEILLPGLNSKKYLKLYFQSALHFLHLVPAFTINAPDDILRIHEVYDSIRETINNI